MNAAFLTLLLDAAPLVALVDRRINWGVQPPGETARPNVNLHHVGGGRDYSLDGPRVWKRARVQVDTWADRSATAIDVWAAVEDLLSGFSGAVGDVAFSMVRLEGDRSANDMGQDGTRLYGRSGDFSFRWRMVA